MLIHLQLLSSIRCSFIAPLLCRCVPAGSKSKGEMCVMSLLCFCAFTGYAPLDYCIYACVTLVHDPLELWSKNPFFFSKIYLDS